MAGIAVVTGGTAGIGLATAELLARRGWSVAVLARDEERLRAAEARLRATGARALGIAADVADAEAVEAAAARVEDELGPISFWVNNAMASVIAPAIDVTPEEFRRVTEVTYLGQVHGTLAALRRMRPRGAGTIAQVSSGLGFRSAPLQSAYCAAKAAVRGFTDSVRTELLHDGIRIALPVIFLPAVNTPQFDWSRNHTGRAQKAPDPVFDPRLAAEAIVHAADHPRREIWVGRSVAQMGAMQRLSPALADRVASRMWEAQLDEMPPAHPEGNLFAPVSGDAEIDGRASDRVRQAPGEFWTDRQRDLAYGVAGLAAGGAVLAAAAPLVAGAAMLGAMSGGRRIAAGLAVTAIARAASRRMAR